MNKPSNAHPEQPILGHRGTQALRLALRTKKQTFANLIICREGELHTFDPHRWVEYCTLKAAAGDAQLASAGGRYLGRIYEDISTWSPTDYLTQLKKIAGTLHDNLAHLHNLSESEQALLTALYETIPAPIRLDAMTQPPPSKLDANHVDQQLNL
ncbi:hypothetical protein LCGC14_1389680 [marine sediment metagenome]|uniref:Uncharacterized protein n=1 Tax=marine sediment metagenome TaxID=412755 RepID=A0A0F9K0I7_9ZZZZ